MSSNNIDCNNRSSLKSKLRREILALLSSLPSRDRESALLLDMLYKTKEFNEAETILAYIPLKTEADISPILKDKRVLVPYIDDQNEMHFAHPIRLKRGRFGLLEPEKIEVSYKKALMLVPIVAVDRDNYRLGRGGGYYDRYIAKNSARLYTVALALSPSIRDTVFRESHDARLDLVLSP